MKKAFIFSLAAMAAILVAFHLLASLSEPSKPLVSLTARDQAVFLNQQTTTSSSKFCYSYYTMPVPASISNMPVLNTSCGEWDE